MGAVKMYRNSSLPSPGTMAADQVRYVKVGSSYIQYVIDNSGVAIPPAVMAHTHNISDVTGLQTALDGKSDTNHTHPNATTIAAGFMSAADKVKLDGLSNYTHPNSGVTPGTYRSVTVDAMGHVTAGTNPTTLAEYGITQRFVSLNPSDGFATPTQASYDLNTAAFTAYGYATTATNRPTGAAANGYFTTNAIDSTSFFQTFANPTVQDAFFYRRKNTSTTYAWLQVASREWVATQISGTVNKIPLFTAANTIGDSILSQSGINVTAAGQFVSDVAPSGVGSRGFGFFANGLSRWTIGKFGLETGSNAGSDLVFYRFNDAGNFIGEAMSINRATGNVTYSGTITASGGNSTQWNAAVPGARTITINGVTQDLTANRSWTVSGSISGTAGRIPKFATSTTLGDSLLSESGIAVTANGGIFVSDTPTNTNVRGFSVLNGGVTRWTFGKAGSEAGGDFGSDFTIWAYNDSGAFLREAMRISRATGLLTAPGISVPGGTSDQWNTAYGWGNHATAGYATLNYVTTNYYSKSYIDSTLGSKAESGISITGQVSLTGGGTLQANRTISLVNDSSSPGANRYYGTNGSGVKGWYSLPSGGGGVTGSGSNGYVPLWNGSTSLTNSVITQTNSPALITIGNSGSIYHLNLWGDLLVRSESGSFLSGYSPIGEGAIVFQNDGSKGFYGYYSGSWHFLG